LSQAEHEKIKKAMDFGGFALQLGAEVDIDLKFSDKEDILDNPNLGPLVEKTASQFMEMMRLDRSYLDADFPTRDLSNHEREKMQEWLNSEEKKGMASFF
jgi:hypothetical protein